MKKSMVWLIVGLCFIVLSKTVYANDRGWDENGYDQGMEIWTEVEMNAELSDHEVILFSADTSKIKGIDVSYAQAKIDWETVKNEVDFVIIRCGYGDDLTEQDDVRWKYNADECARLGIPFGVYLFSYAHSAAEAKSEAEHVLRLIDGYQLSLPVYYDLELRSQELMSSSAKKQMIKTFCDTITEAGYRAGIYANAYWWNTFLTDPIYHTSGWSQWVAHYSSQCGYDGDYSIWQYSCTGRVNGIKGDVDMNYWVKPFSKLNSDCFPANGESEKEAMSNAIYGTFY